MKEGHLDIIWSPRNLSLRSYQPARSRSTPNCGCPDCHIPPKSENVCQHLQPTFPITSIRRRLYRDSPVSKRTIAHSCATFRLRLDDILFPSLGIRLISPPSYSSPHLLFPPLPVATAFSDVLFSLRFIIIIPQLIVSVGVGSQGVVFWLAVSSPCAFMLRFFSRSTFQVLLSCPLLASHSGSRSARNTMKQVI